MHKIKQYAYQTILFFLCLFSTTTASALDTLFLKNNFTEASIEDFGYLYEEEKYEQNFQKIQALPDAAFRPVQETGIYFPAEEKLHWVKFHVKNTTQEVINLLLVSRNTTLYKVQFFQQDADGTVSSSSLTGNEFDFFSRDIKYRFFLYEINIPPGETKTCYTFIDKHKTSLWLKFDLEQRDFFFKQDQKIVFLEAMYFGGLLIIGFIGFMFSCFNQRKIFIYFTFYCLVSTLWIFYWRGYGFMFLWSKLPDINYYMSYFCNILHAIILIALTRSYLQTKRYLPTADKLLKYMQYIFWFFFIYNLLVRAFPPSFRIFLLDLSYFVQIGYLLTIAITTIISYRKSGKTEQLIFLTAFIFTFFALIILPLQHLGVLDDKIVPRYTLHWFFGLDIITLIWLMSLQIRATFLKKMLLQKKLTILKTKAASALIKGQQQERQRLSMNLHDGLSLKLATIKMRLSNVLFQKSKEEQVTEVDNLLNELGNVSEDLRNFTHELSPLDLQEQTLTEAIEDLIYKIKKSSKILQVNFVHEDKVEAVLSDLQCHITYQVVQELLNNVLKHAEATQVYLKIRRLSNEVIISTQDNGKGFDFLAKKEGIGLKNIRLRADFLSGNFKVIADDSGSQFLFSFPLSN